MRPAYRGLLLSAFTVFGLFKRASGTTEKMETINAKGTICAGRMEIPCRIQKASASRMVVLVERHTGVSGNVVVVDQLRGLAFDASLASSRERELTLDLRASHNLAGLVPARLSRARDIWKRA